MSNIAPCKDCPDRTTGDRVTDCHTTCEKYLAFRAEREKINQARKEDSQARTTSLEGMWRMKKNPPHNHGKRR